MPDKGLRSPFFTYNTPALDGLRLSRYLNIWMTRLPASPVFSLDAFMFFPLDQGNAGGCWLIIPLDYGCRSPLPGIIYPPPLHTLGPDRGLLIRAFCAIEPVSSPCPCIHSI